MANSVVRLSIDSHEFDAKLKKASDALNKYFDIARKGDATFEHLDDGVMDVVKAMGRMETQSKSARGQLSELKQGFTDLSLVYKRLTDEEKATPLGKEMAKSLGELKSRIQDTKKDLADISKDLYGKSYSTSGSGIGSMLAVFGGNMLTKATGWVTSEISDIIKQSSELATKAEGIQVAFNKLGRGDILDGLRKATHNTVSDLELMKAAVKFNDFKLPLDQLGTMLAFAQKKAKDTGQSVDYMVESIVNGLGRKSLPILDNLGISAAEVREKMKETGDMTTAVGEIIREQMEKAGDYVETAADRAAQANVELENEMLKLGDAMRETFGFDGWDSMANSIKTKLVVALQNVINLVDGLKATWLDLANKMGIGTNYSAQNAGAAAGGLYKALPRTVTEPSQKVKELGNATDKRAAYEKQVAAYDAQIAERRRQVSAFTPTAGMPDIWKEQREQSASELRELQQIRDSYKRLAKDVLNPPKTPTGAVSGSTGGGGKTGGGGSVATVAKELSPLQQAQKEISALTEEALTADEARRKVIKEEIADLQKQVEEYKKIQDYVTGKGAAAQVNEAKVNKPLTVDEMRAKAQADLEAQNTAVDSSILSAVLKDSVKSGVDVGNLLDSANLEIQAGIDVPDETWQGILDKYNELKAAIGEDPIQIDFNTGKIATDGKKAEDTWKNAASAVQSVGSAFSQIEDPGVKAMGTVMQAIASIALGYAQATVQASSMGPWAWIAFAASGLATMLATISSIHSATGYAEGGIVKGNSYSGDNIGGLVDGSQYVGLNAGELVLNASQQGTLAEALISGSNQGGAVGGTPYVTGEKIVLGINNYGKKQGWGELVFSRR